MSNEYAAVWMTYIDCDTLYQDEIWNGIRNYVSMVVCPGCGGDMYDELLAFETEHTWELFSNIYDEPPYYYIVDVQEGSCECGNHYFMTLAPADGSTSPIGVCIECGWSP